MEEYLDGPEVDVDLVFSQVGAGHGSWLDLWWQARLGSGVPAGVPTCRRAWLAPWLPASHTPAMRLPPLPPPPPHPPPSDACPPPPALPPAQGEPVYGAVTDNWPTLEPYFNETGSNSPSILPSYQQRELLELAVKSCKALGLQIVSGAAAGGEGWEAAAVLVACTRPRQPGRRLLCPVALGSDGTPLSLTHLLLRASLCPAGRVPC